VFFAQANLHLNPPIYISNIAGITDTNCAMGVYNTPTLGIHKNQALNQMTRIETHNVPWGVFL
jgi:hypothetical protein